MSANPFAVTNSDQAIRKLSEGATEATDLGKSLGTQGMDLFGPASKYLKALISGDRNSLMEATMPERRRVIDQYSAAKNAIAEFTPRGGGQAASMNKLYGQEASDLATLTTGARSSAVNTALDTGTKLEGLQVGANAAASQNWASILSALTAKDAANNQMWAGLGEGAGTLMALAFL